MNQPPLPKITSEIAEKLSDATMTDAEMKKRREQLDAYYHEYVAQGFHEAPIAYKESSPKDFGQAKLNRNGRRK